MKPITLRNVPPEVARHIRRRAREKGASLNRTVIEMLREAAALKKGTEIDPGDLDVLAGRWSASEAESFERALARQRRINPELWGTSN